MSSIARSGLPLQTMRGTLPLAQGANPPRPKPTGRDLHNAAQKLDGPDFFPGIDERKSHPLPGSRCLHRREGVLACKETSRALLRNTLPVNGWWPFLTPPSPHEADALLCEV